MTRSAIAARSSFPRPILPLLCGAFTVCALIVMPPSHPGLNWETVNLLKAAALYLAMGVLGALCALLGAVIPLAAVRAAQGWPAALRVLPLLDRAAPPAAVPLALMVVYEGQQRMAVPAAATIAGSILLGAWATVAAYRAGRAGWAAVGALPAGLVPRPKATIALLALAAGLLALFFYPFWLLLVSIPVVLTA